MLTAIYLRISNYVKEIKIPLFEVKSIGKSGGNDWWRWPPVRVVVLLKEPSEFGDKIMFIPGYLASDVVADLESATRNSSLWGTGERWLDWFHVPRSTD